MNYPFWDAAPSYGILMASISILHVFISHFAIGGGLYLVLRERSARKTGDTKDLEYLEKLSKFFVLVSLVLGAVTGVAIWFVIGLLSPAATEVILHQFVWAFGAEWAFFAIEIAAAILYFYGWRRMSGRDHMILGWIYFVSAWMSLFIINGIITFMLTPGEWLRTGDFWDGFFNPTFWPSLVLRTGVSLLLAGLYAQLIASRYPPDDFKARLIRRNANWSFVGLLIATTSFYWYWWVIPPEITSAAVRRLTLPIHAMDYSYWIAAGIALFLVFFGWILPRRHYLPIAIVGMALGLVWFGCFEWFRESIRKPYIITGYMWGNSLEVAQSEAYQESGYLKLMQFRSGDDGADLFRLACRSCHTINGYNALSKAFDGTDHTFIAAAVKGVHLLANKMPPFQGTEEEAESLTAYLHSRIDQRHLSEIYQMHGLRLGRKVFDIRCGICHPIGGPGDKTASLAGLSSQDYSDILEMSEHLGEGMPPFRGDQTERSALLRYLATLHPGEAP